MRYKARNLYLYIYLDEGARVIISRLTDIIELQIPRKRGDVPGCTPCRYTHHDDRNKAAAPAEETILAFLSPHPPPAESKVHNVYTHSVIYIYMCIYRKVPLLRQSSDITTCVCARPRVCFYDSLPYGAFSIQTYIREKTFIRSRPCTYVYVYTI